MIENISSWVTEVDRIFEELSKAGFYLKEWKKSPLPLHIEGRFSKFLEMDILLRAIATCEIDSSYALSPPSQFDKQACLPALKDKTAEECLDIYCLWIIMSSIARNDKVRRDARGVALYLVWMNLSPLLRTLDLVGEVRKAAEKSINPAVKDGITILRIALYLTLELAVDFFEDRIGKGEGKDKDKDSSAFFSRPHLEREFLWYVLDYQLELEEIRHSLDLFIKDVKRSREQGVG